MPLHPHPPLLPGFKAGAAFKTMQYERHRTELSNAEMKWKLLESHCEAMNVFSISDLFSGVCRNIFSGPNGFPPSLLPSFQKISTCCTFAAPGQQGISQGCGSKNLGTTSPRSFPTHEKNLETAGNSPCVHCFARDGHDPLSRLYNSNAKNGANFARIMQKRHPAKK